MAKIDFEKSLAKLEQIVARMEAGDLTLEQLLAKFKEGMNLAEACSKRLNEAERTIEVLVKTNDGSHETKPFPEGAEAAKTTEEPDAGETGQEPEGELPF